MLVNTHPEPALAAIRAWYRLDRAFAAVNRELQDTYGVSGQQVAILRILAERDTWQLADLRAHLSMHPATLGQTLKHLAAKRLVTMEADPTDARRRLIQLTSQGTRILTEVPLVGPVRLRSAIGLGPGTASAADLVMLAAAFNQAVEVFGLAPWAPALPTAPPMNPLNAPKEAS